MAERVAAEIDEWPHDVVGLVAAETRVEKFKLGGDASREDSDIDATALEANVCFERAAVKPNAARGPRHECEHATLIACCVVGEGRISDRARGVPHMHRAAQSRAVVGEAAVGHKPSVARRELNRTTLIERIVVRKDRVGDLRCAAERVNRAARIGMVVVKDAVVHRDR